ncbi:MAG: NAD(P)/FAD-dependent oxidoreductase [Pseudomonadota bacterium]
MFHKEGVPGASPTAPDPSANAPAAQTEMLDVLVIGGGPAGTTAATLLAQAGWQVQLLEKDQHPRFHIGESLLPGNLPILEQLGVLEQVKALGVFKPGADFTAPDGKVMSFPFKRALGDTPGHAFQVRRSEFDQLLFENARHNGVDTRSKHTVKRIQRHAGWTEVHFTDAQGVAQVSHARLVIDASGRDGLVARQAGWRIRSRRHASAAIFGHFRNVARRDGDLTGNISVYWFEHGWVWMIPLRDNIMSVGAVCWPTFLRTRQGDLGTFLRRVLATIPGAGERMQHAELVGEVNATGNYSYRSRRLFDDGVLLVGDAYAFIDPVFSSGVYLAMNSARLSVAPADAWLRGDARAFRRACRAYAKAVNSKIGAFAWFIYRFTTPTMRDLFRNPRNDWQVEQAVVSMLAGDGDGSADIRARLRIFKTIYAGYRLKRITASLRAWRRRRRNLQTTFTDETILS